MDFPTWWRAQGTPDKIVGIGGVALFVSSFLPWYSVSAYGYRETFSAWVKGLPTFAVLLGLLLVAAGVLVNFGIIPARAFAAIRWGYARLGLAALAAVGGAWLGKDEEPKLLKQVDLGARPGPADGPTQYIHPPYDQH